MGMMDAREKEPLPGDHVDDESKKFCVDCKTTKTPLWRGGPAGPKSLCNACGIRFRKRRISMIGMNRGSNRKRDRTHSHSSPAAAATSGGGSTASSSDAKSVVGDGEDLGGTVKIRFMALGEEVLLQKLPAVVKKQRCQRRRKLGEEEQAAVSLMALSCGSVFALVRT